MDKTQAMGLVVAMKDFFGFRQGEGLLQFRDEIKALSQADKDEIKMGLIAEGYNIKGDA